MSSHRAEAGEAGLAGRPTLDHRHVGAGVVQVHGGRGAGAVGEHIGQIAEPDGVAESLRDLVGVDRGLLRGPPGGSDGDRAAGVGQPGLQLVQRDRFAVFGADQAAAGPQRGVGQVEDQHHLRPGRSRLRRGGRPHGQRLIVIGCGLISRGLIGRGLRSAGALLVLVRIGVVAVPRQYRQGFRGLGDDADRLGAAHPDRIRITLQAEQVG